jgi:hypothetical protein
MNGCRTALSPFCQTYNSPRRGKSAQFGPRASSASSESFPLPRRGYQACLLAAAVKPITPQVVADMVCVSEGLFR